MKSPILLLLFALLQLITPAQEPAHFAHFGPQAPHTPAATLNWDEQNTLAGNSEGWQVFQQRHTGWQALFDPRTGQITTAFGPGISVAATGATKAEVEKAATQIATEVLAVAGARSNEFKLIATMETPSMWYAHFVQHSGEFRSWDGRLCLRINRQGKLVMWTVRAHDFSEMPTTAGRILSEAKDLAMAHLLREGWSTPSTSFTNTSTDPVIYTSEDRLSLTVTPTILVKLQADRPRADWMVFIDTRSREVLECWNGIVEHEDHKCSEDHEHEEKKDSTPPPANVYGYVKAYVHEGRLPYQAPVLRPMEDIYVNLDSGYSTTNTNGYYNYNGGGNALQLYCGMNGPFIAGSSANSFSANYSSTVYSGSENITFLNSNSSIAERDMVYFTNKTHTRLKAMWPNITLMDNQINGYVNLTSGTCNAYYSPSAHSVSFLSAGGGCNNMATSSTVVAHEYGHGITTRIYSYLWAWLPLHLGEGFGDCIAAATIDTNLMGAGYQGQNTFVRNLDNSCQYPYSCGAQIHARGKVIGGSYWHTRQLFVQNMGASGKDYMDTIMFRHLAAAPAGEITCLLDMLLLDDDDSNLSNGTPHHQWFYQGFTSMHNVPWPLQSIAIDHEPLLDTLNQHHDYEIHATVNSLTGSPASSVSLHWAVDNDPIQIQTMVPSASQNGWYAVIPNQSAGARVRYFISATDGGNFSTVSPFGAPGIYYSFRTRLSETVFADGFEAPNGWTTGQYGPWNDWMNSTPGDPNHPLDPPLAYEGTKIWGNDVSLNPNWDGYYLPNQDSWIISPSIDCTGRTGTRLVYRRWLTVEDGFYDQAYILLSPDGGQSWTVVWQNFTGNGNNNHIDSYWVEHEIDIAYLADNKSNVKILFELVSDNVVQYGGWNIDDFRIEADGNSPILDQSGSPSVGSSWTLHAQGPPNSLVAIFGDSTLNHSFIPGFGTFSLNPATFLPVSTVGPLPSSGEILSSWLIPPFPGFSFNFQSILIEPDSQVTLSNVITLTITP